ncbi:MAG: amidohydrolase family protein [Gemmatimonadota bacterium]|nr:amidohydrolase family protein [Gemmatimonadota bacterium]
MPALPLRLFRSAWVLPVAAPPFRQGAILVDGAGRIAAVGPEAAIEPPPGAEIVELGEAVLLPGLVNVHAHPELALFRGALEGLRFRDWILRLVGAKRAALGEAEYAVAARWTMVESLRAGITTVAATESTGAAMGALREAGMRGIVYREVFGPDPARAEEAIAELRRALGPLRAEEGDLVRVGISPHAPFTVSDPLYRATAEYALAEALPLAVHASESEAERALVCDGGGDFAPGLRARGIATPPRGKSPLEMLERLGILRTRPLVVHCVRLAGDDISRLAESGSAVAHCPIANARLGHGVAPYLEMRDAGIRIGLGTDSVGSNNRLDLLEEARTASLLQRAIHADAEILDGEELLRLCTVEGARTLGLAERIGTLEPGKDADLCAVSLRGAHVVPVHDPVAALFHSARGSDVTLTVVRGRILFQGGRVLSLNEAGLRSELERAASLLREHLG